MDDFNRLVFERTRLVTDYCRLVTELETMMEAVRHEISKAKNVNGYSLSSNLQPGAVELLPYAMVTINDSQFTMDMDDHSEQSKGETVHRRSQPSKEEASKDEGKCEKRTKLPQGAFRPFGILEPESAKMARREAARSLNICCEMAGIRSRICSIDQRLEVMRTETPELAEQLKKLVLVE